MENIVNMTINLDELIYELKKCDFRKINDEALCQLGLKLRIATTVAEQDNHFTEKQRLILQEAIQYKSVVENEMYNRGYEIVDTDELPSKSPEEIITALENAPFDVLMQWYDLLIQTAEENEDDAQIFAFVCEEISRRTSAMSGGMAN